MSEKTVEQLRMELTALEESCGYDHADVAEKLNELGFALVNQELYDNCEELMLDRMNVWGEALGFEHPVVALALNNLGVVSAAKGDNAKAEEFYRRSIAIWEKEIGPGHSGVLLGLNNLISLLNNYGNLAEAEEHSRRCLKICEFIYGCEEHPEVAQTFNNFARLLHKLGNYPEAELFYRRCLEINEKVFGPEHPNVIDAINNFALLLKELGNYAESEPLYRRNLEILERICGQEHPSVAIALNNLALFLDALGKYADAEPLFKRNLEICERVYNPKHPYVAHALNNLAGLLLTTGNYAKAEPLFRRGLEINEEAHGPNHPDVAWSLNCLAGLLSKRGNYSEAEPLYRRSLEIIEKVFNPNNPEIAISLNNLASLLSGIGNYAEAEPLFLRSLSITGKNGITNNNVCLSYSVLLYNTGSSLPAIFFAKKAVNICQKLRGNVVVLGKDTLKSFDATLENTYHWLAEMLIESDRLSEAEYVLDLLKEEEYFDFVRRDSVNVGIESQFISYNEDEAPLSMLMDTMSQSLSSLYICRDDLQRKKGRSSEEESELTDLQSRIDAASREYDEFLDSLHESFGPEKAQHVDASTDLRSDLWDLEDGTAVIYTLSAKDTFHTILITRHFRKKFSHPILSTDLGKKVLRFRDLVKQRDRYDLEPLAKELYDIVLSQLEADLKDAGITTLLWMLEGSLRLLPVSALHDGEQYIVGKYRNVLLTTKSRSNLNFKSKPHWNALGMGVTCGHEQFKPLPAVKDELEGIVRKNDATYGILPGQILLDADFTWDAMSNELEGNYQVVHIASHFNLDPCNETMSYLLLGDGNHLTLDKLKSQQALFRGVDLLVLSACSTGIGSATKRGREVDGIGYVGETQGAKTVMATLWPVADESTSILMRRFYELREAGNTKAEALRLAQVGLLEGTIKPTKELIERSGENAYRFEIDEEKPYSHPYYWAPFIMIGNWM